jgi:tRNA dimethylallyltransferase
MVLVPILVIAGPTGTGKTALAIDVAARLDGELVGCDALQVYRRFDIGTAKPTPLERRSAPHHLVDCVDPDIDYTLADYVRDADRAIQEISARGKLPIVVGGTGMYLRGLLKGVVPAPPRNPALRDRLGRMADRFGAARLHRWLGWIDPGTAERLPVADRQRIIRGLEIALTSEASWSAALDQDGTWDSKEERYPAMKFLLTMERQALVERIEQRVDRFFEAGLVGEVRDLLDSGVSPRANAFKAIGYREVLETIQEGVPVAESIAKIKIHTRQFSKRQRTWFRKEPDMIELNAAEPREKNVEAIIHAWEGRNR